MFDKRQTFYHPLPNAQEDGAKPRAKEDTYTQDESHASHEAQAEHMEVEELVVQRTEKVVEESEEPKCYVEGDRNWEQDANAHDELSAQPAADNGVASLSCGWAGCWQGTLHIFKQPLLLWISLNVIRARHPVARWCVVSQNGEVSMKWLGSLGAEFGNRRPSGQNLGLGSGLL